MGKPAIREIARRMVFANGRLGDRLERVPVEGEFSVRVRTGQSFRYIGSAADSLGRRLYWRGLRCWEAETWDVFLSLAVDAKLFVDVGAYTGAYTLVACAANDSVQCVALEPVPHVFDRMQENIALNGWTQRATAHNRAVSRVPGREPFWLPDRPFPDTGQLLSSARPDHEPGGAWVEVPTTDLSAELADRGKVDLMKIDVEDAEGPVIAAIADRLARDRPAIIVEMLASGSYAEATDILASLGYTFQHLTSAGPKRVDRPMPRPGDPNMNFLCLP
jgi:FkbM family methyltransferase